MHFGLTGNGLAISSQLRAYAEYRFFTSTARYTSSVAVVQMTLRQDGDVYSCTAVVDLAPSGTLTIQARAPHPNAAIDSVAERAARLLSRRDFRPVSS
jgi:ribosome-associated translation inhibitor RaiA